MKCDLLPGPWLGHACNSWGRSEIMSASRFPWSLSSCDYKRQVARLVPRRKLELYFRAPRNGRRLCFEICSGTPGCYTGSVSWFYLNFFGKWSGTTGHYWIDTNAWWRPSHLPEPLCLSFFLLYSRVLFRNCAFSLFTVSRCIFLSWYLKFSHFNSIVSKI